MNDNVVKNCMYHCDVAEDEEEEEKETEYHEASCLLDSHHIMIAHFFDYTASLISLLVFSITLLSALSIRANFIFKSSHHCRFY